MPVIVVFKPISLATIGNRNDDSALFSEVRQLIKARQIISFFIVFKA